MENFRTPNFELVADLLYWLSSRYDPDHGISGEIEEERDRIEFMKNVASFFLSRVRLRLNLRNLYQADKAAVPELLKIAELLYRAQHTSSVEEEESVLDFGVSSKLAALKTAKSLASEITGCGAKLFDLLTREPVLREAREKAMAFLDSITRDLGSTAEQDYIKRCIREIISEQSENLNTLGNMLAELEKDEKSLDTKITKRRTELERAQKRIRSLQSVRPAYMDEYERLEQELQRYYEIYVLRMRNLSYLEHELDEYSKHEQAKEAEVALVLEEERRKANEEAMRLLRGEEELDDEDLDDQLLTDDVMNLDSRPQAAHSRRGQRPNPVAEESDDEDLIDDVEDDEDSQNSEEGLDSDTDNEF
jgi:clusterin-associated protein 1